MMRGVQFLLRISMVSGSWLDSMAHHVTSLGCGNFIGWHKHCRKCATKGVNVGDAVSSYDTLGDVLLARRLLYSITYIGLYRVNH